MDRHDKEMEAIYLEALEKGTPWIEVIDKIQPILRNKYMWDDVERSMKQSLELNQLFHNWSSVEKEREAYDAKEALTSSLR